MYIKNTFWLGLMLCGMSPLAIFANNKGQYIKQVDQGEMVMEVKTTKTSEKFERKTTVQIKQIPALVVTKEYFDTDSNESSSSVM